MKILICGAGALGSNLTRLLVPDLKGQHEITVLDMDDIEERNVTPGTQWYSVEQIGIPKVEALQYNVYRWFEREIEVKNQNLNFSKLRDLADFDFIIDCFDNYFARNLLQHASQGIEVLHIGFSDQFTFEIEWAKNYQVPSDITSGFDICEMQGAASFVSSVASLGALVVQEYINKNEKISILGNKFTHTIVR
jgi:molybdopterin/thiamine biosynthesis adenylyltransferase